MEHGNRLISLSTFGEGGRADWDDVVLGNHYRLGESGKRYGKGTRFGVLEYAGILEYVQWNINFRLEWNCRAVRIFPTKQVGDG